MDTLKLSTDLQSDLIKVLGAKSTKRDMLAGIVGRAAEVLKVSRACSIFIIEPDGRTAVQRAGTGYQKKFIDNARCLVMPTEQIPEDPDEYDRLGLTGWILSTGKSFLAHTPKELACHPHRSGEHDPEYLPNDNTLQLQSFLGVPLRDAHGDVLGLIKAERRAEAGKSSKPFLKFCAAIWMCRSWYTGW